MPNGNIAIHDTIHVVYHTRGVDVYHTGSSA